VVTVRFRLVKSATTVMISIQTLAPIAPRLSVVMVWCNWALKNATMVIASIQTLAPMRVLHRFVATASSRRPSTKTAMMAIGLIPMRVVIPAL
jgi:hypothetical protein